MAAPKFKIIEDDGTDYEVTLKPKMQIAFEFDTGTPLFDENETVTMTKVYTLAWYAAGKVGTLDEFVENLESVEMVNEETDDDDKDSELPS